MEGLQLLVNFGNVILNAFGIRSMFLAFIGGIFFLTIFSYGWKILQNR